MNRLLQRNPSNGVQVSSYLSARCGKGFARFMP